MPGDSIPFDQFKKVLGWIERQRRLGKMRVFRKKILRPAAQIGKVAPPAARGKNLSPWLAVVIKQGDPPAALPSHRRAHQSSRTGSQNKHIELTRVGGHEGLVKNTRKTL
jgi:hypothetical protein